MTDSQQPSPATPSPEVIDLLQIVRTLWQKKRVFLIVLPLVFVFSCIYIFSLPRYYSTSLSLAPEMEGGSLGGGTLGSIASSFGFDLDEFKTSDAISPLLYPDLMEDNKFVTDLFGIRVKSGDGEIDTTLFDYFKTKQKKPWWGDPMGWVLRLLAPKDVPGLGGSGSEFDPYNLSRKDDAVVKAIRGKVTLSFDKKSGIITISTEAQDPLICKTMADSVRVRLQDFITEYRTSKARRDMAYYERLSAEAKHEYERARQLYGSYADANTDVVLTSYRAKQNDLENDMQLKYNTYTALQSQLQAARAKVQERTPAFTMLKGAAVPVKAAGPKRVIFVFGMMFFAAIAIILYYTIKIIFNRE